MKAILLTAPFVALALLAGCAGHAKLAASATDGMYFDGRPANVVSLYGDCKTQAEVITGPRRFNRVFRPDLLMHSKRNSLTVDIVLSSDAANDLDMMENAGMPSLSVSILGEDGVERKTVDVAGSLVRLGGGKYSERYKLPISKQLRYAIHYQYSG